MIQPISEYAHFCITEKLKKYDIKTVLDIGGKGKMKNRGFEVTNANIKYGIDGRNLPFETNSFDATVSINTWEHIGNIADQIKFIKEAIKVSKMVSLHCFPINQKAEDFLKKIGHNHPCIVPIPIVIDEAYEFESSMETFLTVREHFLLLATIYPKLNVPELYNYVAKYGLETFSVMLEVKN